MQQPAREQVTVTVAQDSEDEEQPAGQPAEQPTGQLAGQPAGQSTGQPATTPVPSAGKEEARCVV